MFSPLPRRSRIATLPKSSLILTSCFLLIYIYSRVFYISPSIAI
nr:MAG TPA: hypothetical protein [Caudoviricetes sp.]